MRWCSLRNLFILLLRQISVKSPTAATRILLGRSDIAARCVDDSLLVTRCYLIKPKTIQGNRRLGDKCYELLPIEVNNQLMFMTPLDHDLVAQSLEGRCPGRRPKHYQKTKPWIFLATTTKQWWFSQPRKIHDIALLFQHSYSHIQ
ncbi:hypothetical protein Tcan_18227 [Toxocara canis]|uniref:Secreted protein n=1 Tax=Toxocara canis TaxID=6265 RepID=A0A0B2V5D3_TOXCA|nr:hypothetical protein Tcan_18227 [Toxocara canis]